MKSYHADTNVLLKVTALIEAIFSILGGKRPSYIYYATFDHCDL